MGVFCGVTVGNALGALTMPPMAALGVAALLLGIAYASLRLVSGADGHQRRKPGLREKPSRKPAPIEPLQGFDWKAMKPRRYRPFKPIYHITMALQSDEPSGLITIDMGYLDRVSLRRKLMSQHGSAVYGCLPAGVDAVREVHQFLLREYLPVRFPSMFRLADRGRKLENQATGTSSATAPPEDATAALRVLGETVEEDMFLLREEPEGHRVVAFVCCFPAGFDPASKLGKLLGEIHAPVPSYEKIGPSMERLFHKLEVGGNVKRLNWSVQTHAELFDCKRRRAAATDDASSPDDEIDMDQTYARLELQTLSRLPVTRAVLFSFRTYLCPIREIKAEGLGPQLADAVEGLRAGNAPGMWAYKGGGRWGERVCEYLRR